MTQGGVTTKQEWTYDTTKAQEIADSIMELRMKQEKHVFHYVQHSLRRV